MNTYYTILDSSGKEVGTALTFDVAKMEARDYANATISTHPSLTIYWCKEVCRVRVGHTIEEEEVI